jgi:hypothetical protein
VTRFCFFTSHLAAISTSSPKAAMRMAWPSPCPGFAITTVARMDTWPIRISRTGQQTLFPDIEYLNALERLWPVVARMTSCQGGSLGALEN